MTSIAFEPWIGSRYTKDKKVRLLLVGDSHYGTPDVNPRNATRTVLARWKSGEWNIRYLIAAARVLSGKAAGWEVDRSADLENIAFYNFVQVSMPWHNVRPTTAEYQASQPAFLEVLAMHDPTHVLVTGKFVWWNLPRQDEQGTHFAGEPMPLRRYPTASGVAATTRIPHLSRYFSPKRWHPPVLAFLTS